MNKIYLLVLSCIFSVNAFARYATPGTGLKLTLANLVASSNGIVTLQPEGNYQVIDTVFISQNDTLSITTNAVVKFAAGTYFHVNGVVVINPPGNVTFTAINTANGYLGMQLDNSNGSLLRKLTLEYAVALRLSDCSPTIDSCIFRYNNNNTSTSFGSSAITLFRSSPLIINSQFLNNQRAAISGGANIANAPKIYNCLFSGNNTQNANVPQINLGVSGTDTVKIINNQILRASTNSGGIGFLPTGNVYVVISGNVIKNNRYGIVLQGGSNINALVSYNQIDSNNIQNDPNLGGSGINFVGGTAASQQNSIVTGNLIRWNLWGITIQNRARPNLGNITNTDTTDDGKNQIYGNTNTGTPNIDVYNSTVDSIYAQNNYWGANDLAVIESHIFHKPDNSAFGTVIYQPFLNSPLPVKLLSFSAVQRNKDIVLNWQTTSEINSAYFSIERSADGRTFSPIGNVAAMGSVAANHAYSFTDLNLPTQNTIVYYRLKQVDKDGIFTYSRTVAVSLIKSNVVVSVYPNPVKDVFALSIIQNGTDELSYALSTLDGRRIVQQSRAVAGSAVLTIDALATQPAGAYILQVWLGKVYKQFKINKL